LLALKARAGCLLDRDQASLDEVPALTTYVRLSQFVGGVDAEVGDDAGGFASSGVGAAGTLAAATRGHVGARAPEVST